MHPDLIAYLNTYSGRSGKHNAIMIRVSKMFDKKVCMQIPLTMHNVAASVRKTAFSIVCLFHDSHQPAQTGNFYHAAEMIGVSQNLSCIPL